MTPFKIDENIRSDHYYLDEDDDCFFFGEYFPRGGFNASPTNQLIDNIKKEVCRRGKPEYWYKERDIKKVANMLKSVLNPKARSIITIVPIPPSKAKDHPEYDDRLILCLEKIIEDGWDVRELIAVKTSMRAHHEYRPGEKRPTPDELYEQLMIDETCLSQKTVHHRIILFDDVLTNGAHFKACKRLILKKFPDRTVEGLFIARRKPKDPFDLIEEIP
ncbi:MAG: hypothetical protein FWG52_10270 [Proteobacteria bacterium]|nr:hypothetical protein [Pseudomonadota bacterium]